MIFGISQADLILWTLNLLRAAAILIVGVIIARTIHAWVLRLGTNKRMAMNLAALLGNLAEVVITLFAVILILPTFGVDWTGLLTLIGTVGLAVSLAFQDLLKNFIAGVYILIERPFQIGDKISLEHGGHITGTVQSIELRVTNLRTEEGVQVIVPNTVLFTEVVTNRSAFNLQRDVIGVTLGLGESSLSTITSRISETLGKIPEIAPTPTPTIRVENITAQAVKLHVEFWSAPRDETRATGSAALALRETFPNADVAVIS